MLSNQTPNFNPGRHQRQNSTPNIFVTSETQSSAHSPKHVFHRRGLSLNQPTNIQPQSTRHMQKRDIMDFTQRGIDNYQQHLLPEAQKQQPLAGPGQNEPRQPSNEQGTLRNIELKPYPEYGHYTFTNNNLISTTPTMNDSNVPKHLDTNITENFHEQASFGNTDFAGYLEGFELGARQEVANTRGGRQMRNQSSPIGDGVLNLNSVNSSSQVGLGRPTTPQNQTNSCYFPLTPDATPFSRTKTNQVGDEERNAGPPIYDPNLTIKASHAMKRGSSIQDLFSPNPISAEVVVLSPPNSERLRPVNKLDLVDFPDMDLMDLSHLNMDFLTKPMAYHSSSCSPMSKTMSSNNSSFHTSPEMTYLSSFASSPEMAHSPLFRDPFSSASGFSVPPEECNSRLSPGTLGLRSYSTLPTPSLHSRSQSISDLDIDATVEDTGISSEEIAAYISGPDPVNGRWVCTYPDCNRGFGRKENIKSHVQTHLGDRQYRCIPCGNTFVRQHDLKRHAKIHSGVKPYPCPCGSNFARHDALTRHRQRNTCVGGFEGICKSPTKRGRPRKIRPEAEARQGKAAKTRQRALEKASSASPSLTGTSLPEDLPELPPSEAMSRETSMSYCSAPQETDMLPALSSPLPTFDFDFDLGSMGALEAQDLSNSMLLDLDKEIGLMSPLSNDPETLASLERELMEQLEEFNGPLSPLSDDF